MATECSWVLWPGATSTTNPAAAQGHTTGSPLDAAAQVMHPKQRALITGKQTGSREITTVWVNTCKHRSTYICINWDPYFLNRFLRFYLSFQVFYASWILSFSLAGCPFQIINFCRREFYWVWATAEVIWPTAYAVFPCNLFLFSQALQGIWLQTVHIGTLPGKQVVEISAETEFILDLAKHLEKLQARITTKVRQKFCQIFLNSFA